jgi:predicted enzyme related to lactoylglutathione lyase
MPGYDDYGPTLEIFEYGEMQRPEIDTNTPGFSHIAFAVDDVAAMSNTVIDEGGSFVDELTKRHMEGIGDLVFQ